MYKLTFRRDKYIAVAHLRIEGMNPIIARGCGASEEAAIEELAQRLRKRVADGELAAHALAWLKKERLDV